jgi:acyl-ACP thioesterase
LGTPRALHGQGGTDRIWLPTESGPSSVPAGSFYIPVDVELVTERREPDPMIPPLAGGRVFSIHRRPGLADCAPSGRTRLDALARWMQDVAYADVEEAGLERVAIWVLRRHRIRVTRFPRFGERCQVSTFCSGVGRMWAERRTTVTLLQDGGQRTAVEAVAVWVHLDPERRLPSPLSDAELQVYGPSAGDRRVVARLRHPRPEAIDRDYRWSFRRTDADIADHVNNAAYWEPLEDELLENLGELVQIDAELEFRVPAQPGLTRILAGGARRWITDPESDEIYASTVLMRALSEPVDAAR